MDGQHFTEAQDSSTSDSARSQDRPSPLPPPAPDPAWLVHLQSVPAEQFPQALVSGVYETTLGRPTRVETPSSLKDSPAFYRFLINNHPVYTVLRSQDGKRNSETTSQLSSAAAANYYLRHESPFRGRSIPPPPSDPVHTANASSAGSSKVSPIQDRKVPPAPSFPPTQPYISNGHLLRSRFRTPPPPEIPGTDNASSDCQPGNHLSIDHHTPLPLEDIENVSVNTHEPQDPSPHEGSHTSYQSTRSLTSSIDGSNGLRHSHAPSQHTQVPAKPGVIGNHQSHSGPVQGRFLSPPQPDVLVGSTIIGHGVENSSPDQENAFPVVPSVPSRVLEMTQEAAWTAPLEQSIQHPAYAHLCGYNFNVNDSHQWTANLGMPRLPLAPQNVEYDQDATEIMMPPADIISDHMEGSDHLVAQEPVFHPPPMHHQIPNANSIQEGSDSDLSHDSESDNEVESIPLKAGQKRKRDDSRNSTQYNKRRTGKRGRPRGRRGAEGPRTVLDPGEDFTKLYNAAMDAFLEENDIQKAQVLILEAISTNPEIFAAHSLLADIHFARGDHESAIDALMVGLHGHANDVELWRQVADTILHDHTEGYRKRVERAMYCFSGILRKDPKDLDARFQRAECARILGSWNKAFGDLNILLQDDPHNSTVLALFTQVCHGVGDTSRAKTLYEEHFDYYKTTGISDENHFTWQDISNYVDLVTQNGQTIEAVLVLKRLARWLCGRESEVFWENFPDDDREFDQMHYPRRTDLPQFEPGKFPEHEYGEALPLDLRGKLGILRLKLGHREEAQAHFDWLEPDLEGEESLVHEYSDTFFEVAKGLLDVKEYKLALQYFDALHNEGIDLGLDFWTGMAACCYVCGRKEQAIEYYEHTLEINPDAIEPRTQLAKLYNDRGNREKALKYGREAVLLAQEAIPATVNRKYERKEQRLIREAATKVLKMAYKMPRAPGKAPGKIPDDLRRTRNTRKFVKYVPRYTERPGTVVPSISDDEEGQDRTEGRGKRTKKGKGYKLSKPPKEPKAPKPPQSPRPFKRSKRQPPSQEDAVRHYEDMQGLYQTLLNHQDAMRRGDETATNIWLDCADAMVKDFRTVKAFYPPERYRKFEGFGKSFVEPRPPSGIPARADSTAAVTPTPSASGSQAQSRFQSRPGSQPDSPSNAPSAEDLMHIRSGIATDYCGIPFTVWLDIHLEFALLTAINPNPTSETQLYCYDTITAASDCTIFYHSERSMVQIHTCWLACCLALGDDYTLFNVVLRWFMREFAFCTDTYRLYSAINFLNELPSSGSGKVGQMVNAEFKSGPNQKFIFRQLVSIDKLLPADYNAGGAEGPVPAFMRRHREELRKLSNKADKNGNINDDAFGNANHEHEPDTPDADDLEQTGNPGKVSRHEHVENTTAVKFFRPKEMDVVLFILYAHILMASNSFTNALSYLYRAYSLDPTNPVCLLSIAFCYMHELFKRQNENRHMYVLFGWAWFGRYEAERLAWVERVDREKEEERRQDHEDRDGNMTDRNHVNDTIEDKAKMVDIVKREIEFNKARCWEMLGMSDLAVRGYKKVLKLPKATNSEESGIQDPEDWSMEAAYAMATLYALNGDTRMAKEITERYLVVE
ncbi:transcription factor TFIIIC subunit tfc4 [Neophaeococcomyces mojaviensis]|uniref:Transcription factor TFIIIC subunit tfc4 n=1 Tax=Neophaeococcomyces mojaviensis TaxID=3383035 RepID=A0ACC3A1Z1_9EURO|nr:transcription factor TFIIIC subunit tfc4 [Knufia sp. JES_112]